MFQHLVAIWLDMQIGEGEVLPSCSTDGTDIKRDYPLLGDT